MDFSFLPECFSRVFGKTTQICDKNLLMIVTIFRLTRSFQYSYFISNSLFRALMSSFFVIFHI